MLGSLEGARSDIESGSHSETTEVLLTLLSQNKALGGKQLALRIFILIQFYSILTCF